jgi:hypothetical protein
MMTADTLEELVRVYSRTAIRYNFASEKQIEGFVESGHKCYGRTTGRQVFVVHRSIMNGEMAYSISDSLAEILLLLALAADQAGIPLAAILDPEDQN